MNCVVLAWLAVVVVKKLVSAWLECVVVQKTNKKETYPSYLYPPKSHYGLCNATGKNTMGRRLQIK
jgi:hypothetical protein